MSNQMTRFENIARPDLILGPGESYSGNPLDPCPSCGSVPHDAPEGIHDAVSLRKYPHIAGEAEDGTKAEAKVSGSPKWDFLHCWKCGFRPGTNVAISQGALRGQFEAFKKFMADEYEKLLRERNSGASVTSVGEGGVVGTVSPAGLGMVAPASADEVAELKQQLADLQAQVKGNPVHVDLNEADQGDEHGGSDSGS